MLHWFLLLLYMFYKLPNFWHPKIRFLYGTCQILFLLFLLSDLTDISPVSLVLTKEFVLGEYYFSTEKKERKINQRYILSIVYRTKNTIEKLSNKFNINCFKNSSQQNFPQDMVSYWYENRLLSSMQVWQNQISIL